MSIIYDTKVARSTTKGIQQGKDYIIQQGGTSSGKTFGNLLSLFQLALDSKDKLHISVVAATLPMLKKGAIKDFDYILAAAGYDGKKNKTDINYRIGNSIIEFFSIDDEGKARGSRRDYLFINECNLIDWTIVYQLMMRTNKTTILDFNPSEEFWLHTEFLPTKKESEYLYKISTYKDNKALTEKIIRDIESLPPDLYRIYGEGKLGQISGLIFTNWEVVDEWPLNAKNVSYGLDFGFTNDPTAMVRSGVYDGCIYVQELIHETGLTTDDIDNILAELGLSKSIPIQADSSEPRLIAELYSKGWYIKGVTKGADSVRAGIMKLKQFKICVTKDSTNLIKELKNYKWKEKDGKSLKEPIDRFNHCVDSLRYSTIDLKTTTGSDVIGWY
jgi:phage terminase large subunit